MTGFEQPQPKHLWWQKNEHDKPIQKQEKAGVTALPSRSYDQQGELFMIALWYIALSYLKQ